jgi:hypothetical protein
LRQHRFEGMGGFVNTGKQIAFGHIGQLPRLRHAAFA